MSKLTFEYALNKLSDLPGWQLLEVDGQQRLNKTYKFKDFKQALNFTIKVGHLAEANNHHPLIVTEWGKVTVQWWSHSAGGVTQADFDMAAKTD